ANQRQANDPFALVRAIGNAAGEHWAHFVLRWIPQIARQNLRCAECPILAKDVLQLTDDWTGHAKVEVLRLLFWFFRQPAALADVHSAGESQLPVDDHDLAVASQV